MFKKMTGAFAAVVIGIGLFCAAFPVLYLNEYWTVETEKGLQLARKSVTEVKAGAVQPDKEGKLVEFSGKADTDEVLADEDFGVSANAVRLSRSVEIFQWVQHKEEDDDDKRPTYSYRTDWVSEPVDSSRFDQPAGHQNPPLERVFRDRQFQAKNVRVGAFVLNKELIDQIEETGSPVVPKLKLDDVPAELAGTVALIDGGFYRPYSASSRTARNAPAAQTDGPSKSPQDAQGTPGEAQPDTQGPASNDGAGGTKQDNECGPDADASQSALVAAQSVEESSSEEAPPEEPTAEETPAEKSTAAKPSEKQAAEEPSPMDSPAAASARTGDSSVEVPSSPEVGDMRIRYTMVRPGLTVSVISGQSGDTLKPWPAGKIFINYLAMETYSAPQLINKMQSESDTKTWIIRVVGVLMMFFGVLLILRPITALAEMVPILGSIVGAGVLLTAALASVALSLITIGVSWIFVRPIYGIPMLVAALVLLGLLFVMRRRKQPQAATAPPLQ